MRKSPKKILGIITDHVSIHRYILELLKSDLKPRDIMTYKAFENAMVTVMATGGSTNAVLHLIAMARAAGVNVTLDDFQRVSDKVGKC
jgi:dihydroxy-acid dehydratase